MDRRVTSPTFFLYFIEWECVWQKTFLQGISTLWVDYLNEVQLKLRFKKSFVLQKPSPIGYSKETKANLYNRIN